MPMQSPDLSSFEWFFMPEKKTLHISIPNPDAVYLSPMLAAQMPERIAFGVKGTEVIAIRQDDAGYSITKSRCVKAKNAIAALVGKGLSLPARYVVTAEESCWICILESKPPIAIDPSKASKKPRRRGLNKLLEKEGEK